MDSFIYTIALFIIFILGYKYGQRTGRELGHNEGVVEEIKRRNDLYDDP